MNKKDAGRWENFALQLIPYVFDNLGAKNLFV